MARKKKEITPQQQEFVDYYIETNNAYQSAIRAGYKESYARNAGDTILQKEAVVKYKAERLKQLESDRIAKPAEVLEFLTRVISGEEKDSFGLDVGIADKTKAAELIGKRYALWKEALEVKGNVSFADALNNARVRGAKKGKREE